MFSLKNIIIIGEIGMSQHISLNNLLGDEFTYNDLDPSIHTLECVDIITDILTCESNIIALEAVKKM